MTEYSLDELAVLAIDSLNGFEYKHKSKILQCVDAPKELFNKSESVKQYLFNGLGDSKAKTVIMALDLDYSKKVAQSLDKKEIVAVTIKSKNYPERLKSIDSPPIVLYAKGDIGLLNSPKTFGAVGSRKTLPYAEGLLKDICKRVSAQKVTVVTGSATGADKVALSSSMEGGKVISVLAGGYDHVYPECNKSLVEKVAKCGLVISEHSPSIAPTFWMFPVRNRIIAGLSDCLLIASGDKKSGARHTAEFGLNYGKSIFAFPYSVGIISGELCNELIKNGAGLCDSADDILNELDVKVNTDDECLNLDDDERRIYDAICNGEEDMTSYCAKNDIKFFQIAPALSSLEIQGLIVKTAGNRFKPVK